ncbi:MAG: ACP S-malonyltransferase [Bacteroidetes bacterium]|nr:ACP S-malonyltransferase [Bacteroidota bacterium]
MSKIAFIFPGQGSQAVGMGKDLFEKHALANELYHKADEIMGFHLSNLCFEGPADVLKETHITQPALYVHSYILTRLIGDKIKADVTAGHSLGEYTANAYAESFSFEDGLRLVKKRGELMKNSGVQQPGTMAAIIGLDDTKVTEVCDKAGEGKIVQPANYNSPGQIVISGDVEAVHRAMKIAKEEYGARMVKELEVSGAFHSNLMLTSAEELRLAINTTNFSNAKIPVFCNVEAEPFENKDKIKNALYRQLMSSVKWETCIRNMVHAGATMFYEIGSGKVLTGLVKKIDPSVKCFNISTAEDLDNLENLK